MIPFEDILKTPRERRLKIWNLSDEEGRVIDQFREAATYLYREKNLFKAFDHYIEYVKSVNDLFGMPEKPVKYSKEPNTVKSLMYRLAGLAYEQILEVRGESDDIDWVERGALVGNPEFCYTMGTRMLKEKQKELARMYFMSGKENSTKRESVFKKCDYSLKNIDTQFSDVVSVSDLFPITDEVQRDFNRLKDEMKHVLKAKHLTETNIWKMLLVDYYESGALPKSIDNAFICYARLRTLNTKAMIESDRKDKLIKVVFDRYKQQVNDLFLK